MGKTISEKILAKAAGVRFGITSSDDAKIERASELGADFTVNYREHSDWDQLVRNATNGRGADVVLETVGPPSIATSVKAAAHGGRRAAPPRAGPRLRPGP